MCLSMSNLIAKNKLVLPRCVVMSLTLAFVLTSIGFVQQNVGSEANSHEPGLGIPGKQITMNLPDPDEVAHKIRLNMVLSEVLKVFGDAVSPEKEWFVSSAALYVLKVKGGQLFLIFRLYGDKGLASAFGTYTREGKEYYATLQKDGTLKCEQYDKKRRCWVLVPKSDQSPSAGKVEPPKGSGRAGGD